MRLTFAIVLGVIILAVAICAFFSYRSKKQIGKSVGFMLLALIPPVLGNLLIMVSQIEELSYIGYYTYFLGMNLIMFALINFTFDYCNIVYNRKIIRIIVYSLLIADTVQLLLNPFFHHSFTMSPVEIEGTYYTLNALIGQTIHRVVDYSILGLSFIIFIIKVVKSPKVYAERYFMILLVMIVVTVWETFYIFSKTPIDRSMIGFGAFGLLIYFFSIHYRPLLLLDRMLAAIASKMPEALFFFDGNGKCIWLNDQALKLVNIEDKNFDAVDEKLAEKFGQYQLDGNEWKTTYISGDNENTESYTIEKQTLNDDRGRVVGSFLSFRDTSLEQKRLQKEQYNSSHDSLTGVYNRLGYNLISESMDYSSAFMVLVDADSFKNINDTYGHEVGDKVLIKMVNAIKKHFHNEDKICRLGGDEFAVIILNADENTAKKVEDIIKDINEDLVDASDGLPGLTISAGGVYGSIVEDQMELFKFADRALYQTKHKGKEGFTLYVKE